MYNEYTAVKNPIKANKINLHTDIFKIEVINMISLIKLIEGGAAIFLAANKNHHIVKVGATVIRPLVRKILRVWVNS
jgi:hypothetical protein